MRAMRAMGGVIGLLALGLVAGCAGLAPLRTAASARVVPPPAPSSAVVPGAPMPAAVDSGPTPEALAVLGTIPEPLSPAERVPPPAQAAPGGEGGSASAMDTSAVDLADRSTATGVATAQARSDSASVQVPVPAPTAPLGERQGAGGQALPDSVLVPSTKPPPAPAHPDTCWRLQIGAPPEKAKAEALQSVASSQLLTAFVIEVEKRRYKVRTRDCMERGAVIALRARAQQAGFKGSFLIEAPAKDHKP